MKHPVLIKKLENTISDLKLFGVPVIWDGEIYDSIVECDFRSLVLAKHDLPEVTVHLPLEYRNRNAMVQVYKGKHFMHFLITDNNENKRILSVNTGDPQQIDKLNRMAISTYLIASS